MTTRTHGELKRAIADEIGFDPDRYGTGLSVERHSRVTKPELQAIARAVGLEMVANDNRQTIIDTLMIKVGRDHRTGSEYLDSNDLQAILDLLKES